MTRRGLILARYRREVLIEIESGARLTGLVRGRKLRPLTGDEVVWHAEQDGTAVIDEILPRTNVLERIDSRGRGEGVAANLSLVAVVVAPRPEPDWQLVDHYLAGAAIIGIDATLVRNKQDIADAVLDERAETYARLGYEVLRTSVQPKRGIAALADIFVRHRGVLVGQSGVGKSSVLNALLGSEAQAVGKLSSRRPLGRHTTTASILHRLPSGGEIIDSPGVRRYAPFIADPADLASGFIEFRPFLGRCRFNDCGHTHEPGCAVLAALRDGQIDDPRYRSYLALRATLERLRSV